jgi:hypothetical protein
MLRVLAKVFSLNFHRRSTVGLACLRPRPTWAFESRSWKKVVPSKLDCLSKWNFESILLSVALTQIERDQPFV